MSLRETRQMVGTARQIGFSRRELLKLAAVAAGGAVVAACGGSSSGGPIDTFVVGTWQVRYQLPRTTSAPPPPVQATLTVNSDGTFTSTGDGILPTQGTWTMGKGFMQISGDGKNAMASNHRPGDHPVAVD
ncbi:MAG: hypothetical protein QM774_11175 [Gordonia sp. (in: high G+C Gram-positive bacteria)]|uniref:hypothetical protein n=1 Tax=Gordonia sp. (in: high G+C Gram-positive bacteria) TaxID=84139 RepID=UPI0039E36F36